MSQHARGPVGRVASVGAVLGFVLLGLGSWTTPARADAPAAQGWWTQGGEAAATVFGPDVPSDGLLVQGGGDSPSAYAALRFDLPPNAFVGDLILHIESATPESELRVCPLTESFTPAQGGDMEDAPDYDCEADEVAATVGEDADSVTVFASPLVREDELAVALLPTEQTDRMVFQEPGDDTLEVRQANTDADFGSDPSGGDASNDDAPQAGSSEDGSATSGEETPSRAMRPTEPLNLETVAAPPRASEHEAHADEARDDEPTGGPQPEVASTAAPSEIDAARPRTAAAATTTPDESDSSPWLGVLALLAVVMVVGLWLRAGTSAVRRVEDGEA